MKRIIDHRKLFDISADADLAKLKTVYRNLMKEWHPDKFRDNDELLAEAELKSKNIIEAYHFLVSVSPETHAANLEEYKEITDTFGIDDFQYKGQTLKITLLNGGVYEYFGVPKNVYNKLINSGNVARFARRHIYHEYIYRSVSKATVAE